MSYHSPGMLAFRDKLVQYITARPEAVQFVKDAIFKGANKYGYVAEKAAKEWQAFVEAAIPFYIDGTKQLPYGGEIIRLVTRYFEVDYEAELEESHPDLFDHEPTPQKYTHLFEG